MVLEYKADAIGRPDYSGIQHRATQYRYTDSFRDHTTVEIQGFTRVHNTKPKPLITDALTKRMLADGTGHPEYSHQCKHLHSVRVNIDALTTKMSEWIAAGVSVKGKKITSDTVQRYTNQVLSINDNTIKFKVGINGRVYTPLTRSSKPVMQFLEVDGYTGTLMHSDLTSAHLLLLTPRLLHYKAQQTSEAVVKELDDIYEMIRSKGFYSIVSRQLR